MNKYIVTHKAGGGTFTNGFILGNYSHSLAIVNKLVANVRADFDVADTDIEVRTVVNSGWCKGYLILRFPLPTGTTAKGWTSIDGKLPDIVIG